MLVDMVVVRLVGNVVMEELEGKRRKGGERI